MSVSAVSSPELKLNHNTLIAEIADLKQQLATANKSLELANATIHNLSRALDTNRPIGDYLMECCKCDKWISLFKNSVQNSEVAEGAHRVKARCRICDEPFILFGTIEENIKSKNIRVIDRNS